MVTCNHTHGERHLSVDPVYASLRLNSIANDQRQTVKHHRRKIPQTDLFVHEMYLFLRRIGFKTILLQYAHKMRTLATPLLEQRGIIESKGTNNMPLQP